jgi:catechol 2,3-dioxygenase-like lactoylglutathione lyase family enzyme
MIIEHLCLNVIDIEKEKNFYCAAFGFEANAKYHNAKTGWENYFLSAPDGGARLELLSHADMPHTQKDAKGQRPHSFCSQPRGAKKPWTKPPLKSKRWDFKS